MTTIAIHSFGSLCRVVSSRLDCFDPLCQQPTTARRAPHNNWDIIFYLCEWFGGSHLAFELVRSKAAALMSNADYYYWNLTHILNFRFAFVDVPGRAVSVDCAVHWIYDVLICADKCRLVVFDYGFSWNIHFRFRMSSRSCRREHIVVRHHQSIIIEYIDGTSASTTYIFPSPMARTSMRK